MKTTKVKSVVNPLVSALRADSNVAYTGNLAKSNKSTLSALVDFFGKGGTMRSQDENAVTAMFSGAYGEDKALALKTLFYLSDVREGQGERRLFRTCFKWLATADSIVAKKLIPLVGEYRRFDDIYESLENTPLEIEAWKYYATQLKCDARADKPTLAPKWAPSINTSSAKTCKQASKLAKVMKLSPRNYRRLLSSLRAKIKVVEQLTCANKWNEIDYSSVPSRAALIYKKAFNKHDPTRYSKFLTKVEKGEEKINSAVLYPYDIVREITNVSGNEARTLEAQWKALPDYLKNNPHYGFTILDTSGSMSSSGYYGGKTNNVAPIDVAVSLGIYFAERNEGPFKNCYMVFNNDAEFQILRGATLKDKVEHVKGYGPCGSTNIQAAFEKILSVAVANKVKPEFMPSVLYIISDMQFNQAVSDNSLTNLESIKLQYKKAGYKVPNIVFWCVNSYGDSPVTINDKGVALVSGCNGTILKNILNGPKVMTPIDVMLNTINVARYSIIDEILAS